ncbi:MAG TPA: peptidylprolyl isomerase [Pirellulales bacterium]|jgi:cyclophilin family peptidyl-prolyl cis-trans isomerase|nr:peptidylprolyl isomerase [Pirellulales bacterium]
MNCSALRSRVGLTLVLGSLAWLGGLRPAAAVTPDTVVRFNTSLGSFDVELFNTATPVTVQNFLTYVSAQDYNNSFFHRLVSDFVLQGGGYTYDPFTNAYDYVPSNAAIVNEFSATRSNLAGTIAMAKTDSGPDTATNQFFFNLADNSSNLDNQNGGFTVFGQVINNGMTVVNALAGIAPNTANVTAYDASSYFGSSDFSNTPLVDYPSNSNVEKDLEEIFSVVVVPTNQWNPTTGGTWSNTANWSDGVLPSGSTATAVFGNNLVGAGTIDLGSTPQTLATLDFASGSNLGAYTIAGTGLGVLSMNGGSVNAIITLDSTNSQNQTISAPISYVTDTTIVNVSSGNAALILSGMQNWNGSTVGVASGNVKFSGATTGAVSAGATLKIALNAAVELAGTTSATAGVQISNSGALLVSGTNQTAGNIDGTGSTTVAVNATLTAGRFQQDSLTIHGAVGQTAAKAVVAASGMGATGDPAQVSVLNSLSIDNDGAALGSRQYYGALDLKNNDLIITQDSATDAATALANVTDMIRAGASGGNGIVSGSATSVYGIGVKSNDDGSGNPVQATFDGQGVDANATLVKYTLLGDLNLDGVVDGNEIAAAVNALNQGKTGWTNGDTDYSGTIDANDLGRIVAAYDSQAGSGTAAALPEPSTLLLAALGLMGLFLTRRPRSWAAAARIGAAA